VKKQNIFDQIKQRINKNNEDRNGKDVPNIDPFNPSGRKQYQNFLDNQAKANNAVLSMAIESNKKQVPEKNRRRSRAD
jgi:hypothetical protein